MPSIWNKIEEIINPLKNEEFGWRISNGKNSEILAISSPSSDDYNLSLKNSGNVKVYSIQNSNTSQMGDTLKGISSNQSFGYSIDLSKNGEILAVGSPGDDSNVGFINVYEFKNNSWTPLGNQISGNSNNDYFGWSLNLSSDGKTLAIGDPFYDLTNQETDVGSVQVYSFNQASDSWEEVGNAIFGKNKNENLGYDVDLDTGILAIGSPEKGSLNKNGFVSTYQLNTNQWIKLGNDIVGEEYTDESGSSISLVTPNDQIDGALIAIGAMKNDGNNSNNSGHVRVYQYDLNNNNWIQKGNDIDGSNIGDLSSYSIDLSQNGDYLSIGSIKHDYLNVPDAGQVRIYSFDQNTNIWRQSGFDIGGAIANENFGASLSFAEDGNTLAVSSLNGGLNNAGNLQIYKLGETIYPVIKQTLDNNNSIIRYSYKLLDSVTGEKVTGVNLWTLDDSGEKTIFDEVYSQKKYDLLIEAKTTDQENLWNLETFDLTLNLADGVFSNFDSADILFGSNVNFAKSHSYLDKNNFNGVYSQQKEGLRITGAIGSELNAENRINTDYVELFRIKNLSFDQSVERGNENGETLALDIISNDYDSVISNYQDTDNDGILDNAFIASLDELGYSQSNKSFEIDRTNEIYTYQTFAEMVEHGTTLWTQREIGSNSKTFLIRNGSTVNGRSWWSNIGNFESELDSIVAENLGLSNNNLSLIGYSNKTNLSNAGENTVKGYSVTKVSNDGKASSWDDSTSETFSVDLKVKVNGSEGEAITGESFYSLNGDDFKGNESVKNTANLLSTNIITYQGDLNYDGRVSLVDLAYLNAGKINADKNSYIASRDVDANFDGEITVADIAVLEKDFLKSIHDNNNHNQSWDETKWQVPVNTDSERIGLAIGSISEFDTLISFDNSSFLQQQNLEDLGVQLSVNIPLTETL